MLSNFQKHVLEEINETGEYTFILLIPHFLELEKGITPIINGHGIGEHSKNYYIKDSDFMCLKEQVIALLSKYNLGIYKYIGFDIKDTGNNLWEDSHILLNKENTNRILNKKENWIYKNGAPGYFIAEKD